jgi:hypothetical protein
MCFELRRGRILEYRDESQRLEQCGRLYDAGALKRGFEDEAATVRQVRTACGQRLGTSIGSKMRLGGKCMSGWLTQRESVWCYGAVISWP